MAATATSGTAVVTLPTDTQILITREFNAPKDLVYRAWTTPDLIKRWWAGDRGEVTVAEIDLRVGGTWRYAMTANGGFEVAFHGEFREIVPNERIVSTDTFEGMPDAGEAVNTISLTEENGRTTLTMLVQYPNREIRDVAINSGMEGGLQEALDDLEERRRRLHDGVAVFAGAQRQTAEKAVEHRRELRLDVGQRKELLVEQPLTAFAIPLQAVEFSGAPSPLDHQADRVGITLR